jgi:3-isopropylmalate/(R)-2-methylmalate dehydratase large subunit
MSMDERMTICNMSIEGGARAGYVNPDETTSLLCGPAVRAGGRRSIARRVVAAWPRDPSAAYDDVVTLDAAASRRR